MKLIRIPILTPTIRRFALRIAAWACMSVGMAAVAGELYRTDFEAADGFTAGDGNWVGTDGWVGINAGGGAQGIDFDIIPGGGLGQTASIGYNQPVIVDPDFPAVGAKPTVFLGKSIPYSPAAGELPVVEVQTIIGIQDSTVDQPARDSFFVTVYNIAGNFLAGVRFANQPSSYGIWRLDGTATEEDTGVIFYRGQLHLLTLRVDLPNNLWSADMDGIPLFTDAVFNATSEPVDFGYLGYEWQLSASNPMGYGDNWMLVADVIVRSCGRGLVPFRFSQFECNGTGAVLEWPGEIGFNYQMEYSADLANWHSDLPDSSYTGIAADQVLTFTDSSAGVKCRFYRVLRTEMP